MKLYLFMCNNKWVILCMILGNVLAYFLWSNFGIYWGTYPLSSECWVNCLYGCLGGGLVGCLLSKNEMKISDT